MDKRDNLKNLSKEEMESILMQDIKGGPSKSKFDYKDFSSTLADSLTKVFKINNDRTPKFAQDLEKVGNILIRGIEKLSQGVEKMTRSISGGGRATSAAKTMDVTARVTKVITAKMFEIPVIARVESVKMGRSVPDSRKYEKQSTANIMSLKKDIGALTREGTKRGSIFTADVETHRRLDKVGSLLKSIGRILKGDVKPASGKEGEGYRYYGGSRTEDFSFKLKRYQKKLSSIVLQDRPVHGLASELNVGGVLSRPIHGVASMLKGKTPKEGETVGFIRRIGRVAGGVLSQIGDIAGEIINLFSAPLVKQLDYYQDIRQTLYETEGITRGITDDLNEQQTELEKYSVGLKEVEGTNQHISVIQATQVRNIKRGIRDTTLLNRVTMTGLSTARMLGANAEATAEYFADMAQNLGMSTTQIGTLGISLRQIARETGVTGDNLVRIAKSSEEFMRNMRNSGTFTGSVTRNMIQLMAEATRRGASEGMNRLLSTLSGNMFTSGGDERTRSLALVASGGNADLLQQLQTGTLLQNRRGIRQFGQGLENVLNMFTGGRPVDRLNPYERTAIDATLRETFGVAINELRFLADSAKETGKGFAQRYEELQAMRPRVGLTQAKIDETKRNTVMSQLMEYLRNFGEALGDGTSTVEDALSRFNRSTNVASGDFTQDMNALRIAVSGGGATKGTIEEMLQKVIQDVNSRLTRMGRTERAPEDWRRAINSPTGTLDVLNKIIELNELANSLDKADQDKVSLIEKSVKNIEAMLADFVNKFLKKHDKEINDFITNVTKAAERWIKGIEDFIKNISDFIGKIVDGPIGKIIGGGLSFIGGLLDTLASGLQSLGINVSGFDLKLIAVVAVFTGLISPVRMIVGLFRLLGSGLRGLMTILGLGRGAAAIAPAVGAIGAGGSSYLMAGGGAAAARAGGRGGIGGFMSRPIGRPSISMLGGAWAGMDAISSVATNQLGGSGAANTAGNALYGLLTGSADLNDIGVGSLARSVGRGALIAGPAGALIAALAELVKTVHAGIDALVTYNRALERGAAITAGHVASRGDVARTLRSGARDAELTADAAVNLFQALEDARNSVTTVTADSVALEARTREWIRTTFGALRPTPAQIAEYTDAWHLRSFRGGGEIRTSRASLEAATELSRASVRAYENATIERLTSLVSGPLTPPQIQDFIGRYVRGSSADRPALDREATARNIRINLPGGGTGTLNDAWNQLLWGDEARRTLGVPGATTATTSPSAGVNRIRGRAGDIALGRAAGRDTSGLQAAFSDALVDLPNAMGASGFGSPEVLTELTSLVNTIAGGPDSLLNSSRRMAGLFGNMLTTDQRQTMIQREILDAQRELIAVQTDPSRLDDAARRYAAAIAAQQRSERLATVERDLRTSLAATAPGTLPSDALMQSAISGTFGTPAERVNSLISMFGQARTPSAHMRNPLAQSLLGAGSAESRTAFGRERGGRAMREMEAMISYLNTGSIAGYEDLGATFLANMVRTAVTNEPGFRAGIASRATDVAALSAAMRVRTTPTEEASTNVTRALGLSLNSNPEATDRAADRNIGMIIGRRPLSAGMSEIQRALSMGGGDLASLGGMGDLPGPNDLQGMSPEAAMAASYDMIRTLNSAASSIYGDAVRGVPGARMRLAGIAARLQGIQMAQDSLAAASSYGIPGSAAAVSALSSIPGFGSISSIFPRTGGVTPITTSMADPETEARRRVAERETASREVRAHENLDTIAESSDRTATASIAGASTLTEVRDLLVDIRARLGSRPRRAGEGRADDAIEGSFDLLDSPDVLATAWPEQVPNNATWEMDNTDNLA